MLFVSVCLWIPLSHQLMNAWSNPYETWYVYHGNWTHLNDVLHKSLPAVCVSLCVSLVSLLDNNSVKTFPWQRWIVGGIVSQLLTLVHRSRIIPPWRWRRYIPPKRRLTQVLHSATSQKTTFFKMEIIALHNTVHKTTSRLLSRLLSLVKNKTNEKQISELSIQNLKNLWMGFTTDPNCALRKLGFIMEKYGSKS
jgi:hypothetical protein